MFFQQPQYIPTATAQQPPQKNRHRSTKSQTILEPLILASMTKLSASASYIDQRRANIVSLFRRSLSYNPSGRGSLETMRFVEKFRYLLVSSSLLDPQVSVHPQQHPPTSRAGLSLQRRQRRWSHRNSTSLALNITAATANATTAITSASPANRGTSAAVVLLVILAWVLKQDKRSGGEGALIRAPGQRQVLVVVVTFGTLLVLFSYARRRMLRCLRARVLEDTEALIDSCRRFDAVVLKNIAVLQELELIAANGASVPGLHGDTGIRETLVLGKHLRATLSAVLYLALTTSLTAIVAVLPSCSFLDLEKYLNIYELDITIIQREFCSFPINNDEEMTTEAILRSITGVPSKLDYFGAYAATASVRRIREELQKLHFLRRLYTCCLLAQPGRSPTNVSSWSTWLTVDDSLLSLVELFDSLGVTLNETRDLDILSPVHRQQEQKHQQNLQVDRNMQLKLGAVSELQQKLFQLESTLEVLRDELLMDPNSSIGSPPPSAAIITAGLDDIVELWDRRPFVDTASPLESSQLQLQIQPSSPPPPPLPLAPPLSPRPYYTHHRRHSSEFTTLSGATVVLEGTAHDRFSSPKGSNPIGSSAKPTREQRIAALALRRRVDAERKAEQQQKASLMLELDNVLKGKKA